MKHLIDKKLAFTRELYITFREQTSLSDAGWKGPTDPEPQGGLALLGIGQG